MERKDAIVGVVVGRVDDTTWQDFTDRLGEAVRQASATGKALIVDFAGLDYMSSRGLRALTLARREADNVGVGITLAAPNDIVREILAISRYDQLFAVTDTVRAES